MSKIVLKKSSVTAKVPLAADLDYGELALNYTDGKLYFKNAANAIKSFTIDDSVVTLTGTQTLTNKTFSAPTITGGTINNTVIGDTTAAAGNFTTVIASGIVSGLELTSTLSSGDEGGQINLAKAQTNTTLAGGVTIDVYQNKLRIFEQGGTARGVYIDLSAAAAGVATNLISSGGGATGTVTSVSGTGTVKGLTLTGTVTSSGSLTLGGTLDLSTAVPIGSTSANSGAFTSLTASMLTLNTAYTVQCVSTITTTSTTANQVVTSAAANSYKAVKFFIRAYDATANKYHATEIIAVHGGGSATHTEYGSVNIGGICGTFDVDYSTNSIRLLVTPVSSNTTTYTVVMQGLT